MTGLNGPLAPYLQAEFGLSRAQIGWLTTSRFIATVAVALPAGYIIGRIGVRSSILASVAGFALTGSLFAMVTHFYQAYVIFFVMGIAFAIVNPATTKAIMDYFPVRGRATIMAFKQMGVPLGGVAAAMVFPFIADIAGWRISVWAAAGASTVALLLISRMLKPSELVTDRGEPASPDENPEPEEKSSVAAGQGSLLSEFIYMIRDRDLVLTSILQGAFMTAQVNLGAYLLLYFNEQLGFHVVLAGAMLASAQVAGTIARILWGMVSDYWLGGRVNTLRLIGFVMSAGLVLLGTLNRGTATWLAWFAAIFAGVGSLGWAGTVTLLRAELVGRERAALATGFGMTMASWGSLAGPPIFGWLVDVTGTYSFAWWGTAALTLLSTLAFWKVREPKARRETKPVAVAGVPNDGIR